MFRQRMESLSTPVEVIIVVSKNLKDQIGQGGSYEKIVVAERDGRGYAFTQGIKFATGKILVFLHADTILPVDWDHKIINAFRDRNVVGGGFSLKFDTPHYYLKLLVFMSDLLFDLTGEMWGDRALFIRSELIKEDHSILEVPLMEDVRLSHFMKKKGKVVKLKGAVITSSDTFVKRGLVRHTFKIIRCRLWYALGGNLDKIYRCYYSIK